MFRSTTPLATHEPLTLPPAPWTAPLDRFAATSSLRDHYSREYGVIALTGNGDRQTRAWCALTAGVSLVSAIRLLTDPRDDADLVAFLGTVEAVASVSQPKAVGKE